ncbi:MAG: response regulator [Deltaproteobacteria bacterium]|jgi:signal transduction histidine kinase/DNA-binding response OmpR family regulator|nr:response regulator [Deltaproteobacteria bacterium]
MENPNHNPDIALKILFDYLRDVIYNPTKAKLDPETLPGDARNLGLGIMFLAECIRETRAFANSLARGDLTSQMPSAGNEIAAPLKTLYSSLKHLTWQAQQIAAGDYSQNVDFMGEFADSFNSMIRQLDQRNRELVMSKLTAEAASRAKSTFLATVSHEMRTPLNAILGLSAVELQREGIPTLTRMNLEKIWNAGSSLLRIVNDILDISKAEAGNFEIIPVDYNVAELVNDVVQINIVRIGSKPIIFELYIDETIPLRLSGDFLRVKQILNNLLSNAFKYTERGKVRFSVSWRKKADTALMTFTVSDTGIGIKREDMGRLFTENSQINSEANRYVEGTGLGLSITKYLIDLMGGVITADSEYGVGSEFKASFPQKILNEEPMGAKLAQDLMNFKALNKSLSVEGNLVRTRMPYGHVLLVDDVPTNLDVAEGLLSPYGLKVSCASSGSQAVELVAAINDEDNEEAKYDLIFMDHMMPGMDGIESTQRIRALPSQYAKTVPIVAFTANAVPGNDRFFLNNGFNAFMAKPIDIMQLDAALNRWVRRASATQTGDNGAAEDTPEAENMDDASDRLFADVLIDGLDITTGINRYGKEDKYLKVLKSYILHTPKLLENLKASARGSLSDYAISVHGLKGSSYGISANVVGDIAFKLEKMAKEGNTDSFAETHLFLVEKTEKLISDITNAINKLNLDKKSHNKAKLPKPDNEVLTKLLDASRRGKTSLMEEHVMELEKFDYDHGQDLVVFLRENLENFDYDRITRKLEELLIKSE